MNIAKLVTWVFAGRLVGLLTRVPVTGRPRLIRDVGLGLGLDMVASVVLPVMARAPDPGVLAMVPFASAGGTTIALAPGETGSVVAR